ncbi:hypothetical protein P7C70_g2292, partial [Phenoliferia sp. Uapishka_3]
MESPETQHLILDPAHLLKAEQHLCSPSYHLSLPLELLAKVCVLSDVPDLLSLALVAKDWNAAATDQLYRYIAIPWTSSTGVKLIWTCESNPSLRRLVRKVAAHFTTEEEWREEWLWDTKAGALARQTGADRFPEAFRGTGSERDNYHYEGFLRHQVSSAWYLAEDAAWLKERGEGVLAFYTFISTLTNLRHLTTVNFDASKISGREGSEESGAPDLAASILASLDQISITSEDPLCGDTTSVNLKILPHLANVRHLDLNMSGYSDLSSMGNGASLLNLDVLRMKVSGDDRLGKAISIFQRVVNLAELHIFLYNTRTNPAESTFLLLLSKEIPRLSNLRCINLNYENTRRDANDGWTIFSADLSDSLAKTKVKILRLRNWPPESFLLRLPKSITIVALLDLSPIGSENREEMLEECLKWKTKYLPNLVELRISERSGEHSASIEEAQKWLVTTQRARGFSFSFTVEYASRGNGDWHQRWINYLQLSFFLRANIPFLLLTALFFPKRLIMSIPEVSELPVEAVVEDQHQHLSPPSYHLSLPLEILAQICVVSSVHDLLSLALVAKDWNSASTNQIYGNIDLEWRASTCQKLIRTCESNPSLRRLIRGLAAKYTTEEEWREEWLFGTEAGKLALQAAEDRFPSVGDDELGEGFHLEGFLRHQVSSAWYFAGDAAWLKDRGEGFHAFYKLISTLSNLRRLTTINFDQTTMQHSDTESDGLELSAPVLSSLEHLSLTSNDDDITRINLKILPHLSAVRHLDLSVSETTDLSSMSNGPSLSNLEYLRLKIQHDHGFGNSTGIFRRIVNLRELHVNLYDGRTDPGKSGFLPFLIKELPRLSNLRHLTLHYETMHRGRGTIFTSDLSSALAKSKIESLRLFTLPPDVFLSLLPSTITTLAIGHLSPMSLEEKEELFEKCLGWKSKFLPNLVELQLSERSSQPGVVQDAEERWEALTQRAKGFVFTFTQLSWRRPGEWQW